MTVPFEATPEMVKAGLDLVWEESETHSDLVSRLWRAMAAVAPDQSAAARDVLSERRRQIEAEGWTPEHDDQHEGGELAFAAASYVIGVSTLTGAVSKGKLSIQWAYRIWPRAWDLKWWKPKSRRENLIRAAALILAEIERLDRLSARPSERAE